jgi:hypothetical protein
MAKPIPLAPPVMTATFPLKSRIGTLPGWNLEFQMFRKPVDRQLQQRFVEAIVDFVAHARKCVALRDRIVTHDYEPSFAAEGGGTRLRFAN